MTTLRLGDTGPEVRLLQRLLAAGGYYDTAPTGRFDQHTEVALFSWQARWGLTKDGTAGPETWASFEAELPIRALAGFDHYLTDHFTLGELACRHCGLIRLRHLPDLCDQLQAIREHFNKPLHITSGYRCAVHNADVGGEPDSYHLFGMAADVMVPGVAPAIVRRWAWGNTQVAIGAYRHFSHFDIGTRRWFVGAY